jgi:hypothetical protein
MKNYNDHFKVVVGGFNEAKKVVFHHYNIDNCKKFIREFLKSQKRLHKIHNHKTRRVQLVYDKWIIEEKYFE